MQKSLTHYVSISTAEGSILIDLGDPESIEEIKKSHGIGITAQTKSGVGTFTEIRMRNYRDTANQNSLGAVVDAIKELSDNVKAANGYEISIPKPSNSNKYS